MDSDLTGFIIAVVVGVCIALIESRSKAKKRQPASQAPRAPKHQRTAPPMRPRSAPPAAQSHTHIAPAQQQVKPDQFIIGEEGQRVTTDTPDNPHQQEQPRGLRPLDRDGLRNAVIWGEILKPKF